MKLLRLAVALVAAVLGLLLTAGVARADVDAFEFESFHARYDLGVDGDRHSTLRTTETLVALFPDHDQNRGIKRILPTHFDDVDIDLQIEGVVDENGARRDFTVADEGENKVVTVAVPPGQYVHGRQTYVLTYTQRDVTVERDGRDEFYWNVNGTGWPQPFGRVSAELHVDPQLANALTGEASCYRGPDGSTARCDITRDGTAFTAAADRLGPHENMTVAVGFAPGTFASARPNFLRAHGLLVAAAPVVPALVMGLLVLVLAATTWRNARSRGPVRPRTDRPAGIDLFLASDLVDKRDRGAVASMVDFLVRGNVSLTHRLVPLNRMFGARPGRVFVVSGPAARSTPVYGLAAVTDHGLTAAERTVAGMLFPPRLVPGEIRWFDRHDPLLASRVIAWRGKTSRRVIDAGLRRRPSRASLGVIVAMMALTAFAQAVGLYALVDGVERSPMLMGTGLLGIAATTGAVFLTVFAFRRRMLTREGRELADHLDGLGLAARNPALLDPREAELLLPFAVLFGAESSWTTTFGPLYRAEPPHWMRLDDQFIPAGDPLLFLGGFVAATADSYTGANESSDGSGGSGGGGSSGGGGGGGGGGGV
ncbi:MAG: DUF2207 domain-containing protein [Gordonia sp. (in: high G+C Gram-positive bacteria)]